MITIQEHIQLQEIREKVFSIIGNFSHLTEWDPGISSVEKITPGELKLGTEFLVNVSFFFKEIQMKYTLLEYEENQKVVYKGETEEVEVIDTIEFSEKAVGSVVHYKAEFLFKKLPKGMDTIFKVLLENTANNAFEGMRKAFSKSSIIEEGLLNRYSYKFLFPIIYDFSKLGYSSSKQNFRAISENLSGKTAIITGGSSGIGFDTALMLAGRGANILIIGKNENKLIQAKNTIIEKTGNKNIEYDRADLSLMNEIKLVSKRISEKYPSIEILINNAGALFNEKIITSEGFEKSFALLLLGPFLLTNLLLEKLKKSKNGARIINVSSGGMYTQKLEVFDFQSNNDYNGSVVYAKVKRGLVVLSEYWAEKFKKEKIASYSMHPGWADTEAVKNSLPEFYDITKFLLRTPKEGADTIFWLSCAEELKNKTGGFYLDRKLQPQHVFFTENSKEDEVKFLKYLETIAEKYLKN